MLPLSPGSDLPVPLTPRITLHPSGRWHGHARVAPPGAAVLGSTEPAAAAVALSLFEPAEPAVELVARPVPPAGVLGAAEEQAAVLEYQPAEAAVYVLLQEVHTADGIIYDWALPLSAAAAAGPRVLGAGPTGGVLRFPINPVVGGDAPPPAAGVLGLEDLAGSVVGDIVLKRVLQVFKSRIEGALLDGVKRAELEPRVLALRDTFQPLDGFGAWRALLPPGSERRVLLYLHSFASSTASSGSSPILAELAPGYDAVLSYDHPTLTRDPLQNALDLLAMVPDDLRLTVDLVAHGRGGLVARSLVELAEAVPQLAPRVLVTHGTPHAGTRLADPERWDRLISLGMTAASWLAASAGVALWLPKLLEYVLKAAAQGVVGLPGVAAMTPGGDFIRRLNAAGEPGPTAGVRYAAVASSFSLFAVKEPGFRQAFEALAAQAFFGEPNDLVVPTASMTAIDRPARMLPAEQQLKVAVDHFSYFKDPQVVAFLRRQLGGQ
jgi:hypothetical protein